MKLYNSYLLRKIIGYFLVVASTLVLLIWFGKAMSFVKFITEKGIKLTEFLNLFLLILPWLLLLIIPIALFIAVLAVYNQMSSHNEITILKNAGLNKFSLAKSTINIAIFCCLVCYVISFFVMPWANKKLRFIKSDFGANYANLMINPGIFENLNSLTIYVKSRDSKGKLMGVFIYDNRNSEYSTAITAESGNIEQSDNVLLYLNRGTVQRFNYATKKSDILNFDSYVVNLSDNNQAEVNFRWKAQEMYVGELLNPDPNSSAEDLRIYRAELHQRITYPLLSLILGLIAASCILSGKFSRFGNLRHNILAFILALLFVVSIMVCYNAIARSAQFIPLLYLDILVFSAYSTLRLIRK